MGETEDFLSLQDSADTPQAIAYLDTVTGALQQMGLDPEQVRNATVFTVRDRAEVLTPIRTLVERTFESDHPVRNLQVDYKSYFNRP